MLLIYVFTQLLQEIPRLYSEYTSDKKNLVEIRYIWKQAMMKNAKMKKMQENIENDYRNC